MGIVAIAGMHCSGTSIVARLANIAGVSLRPPEELMPGSAENPRGFCENEAIKSLNDEVLGLLGGSWSEPPTLWHGWEHSSSLDDVRRQARALVERLTDPEHPFGWKDPRMSILMPFWRSVAEIDGLLMPLRDPQLVALSLQRRNGFDPEHSADLWTRYMVDATLNGSRCLVLPIMDVLGDPGLTVRRIASFIGLPEPGKAELQEAVEFVSSELLTTTAEAIGVGPRMIMANELFRQLTEAPDEPSTRLACQGFRGQWYRDPGSPGDPVERHASASLQEKIEQLGELLTAVTNERAALVEELGKLEEERRTLQDHLDQLEASNARQTVILDEFSEMRLQLKEAQQSASSAEWQYTELRSRRVVRLGLTLASVFRPVFRLIRSSRGRTMPAQTRSSLSAEQASVPGSVMVADQLARMQATDMPTVIIPVYNAPDSVERCLASVIRNTPADAHVVIIDDASTDERIPQVLGRYASDRVLVLSNPENLGFVRTVNRGFTETDGDVVILNSDTEVTPGWLQNMRLAAYSDPRVGTVTPFSNNAGAFSAPEVEIENPLPPDAIKDDIGRAVTRLSRRLHPEGPTGNGFCMYIKRDLLRTVGFFDSNAFPRGYGEENDLCMRALRAGWRHIIDDATYVFHEKAKSFGSERALLLQAGRKKLDEFYPDYGYLVGQFLGSATLATSRSAVGEAFAHLRKNPRVRTRVLFVIHEGAGGTPATNLDLMTALQAEYETFVLTSDASKLVVSRLGSDGLEELESFRLSSPVRVIEESRADYREYVAGLLVRHAIELVHVRHLIGHTFDLPHVARAIGIPVVVSFHDFYLSCPTIHLLDERDRFCGGTCTPGAGTCRLPMRWLSDAPPLKHEWVYTWRERGRRLFSIVDAFVTTSETARTIYLASYPELANVRFEVIEHGRDLQQLRLATKPSLGEPIRILLPGNLNVHKGADFVRRLRDLDITNRLEFHIVGDLAEEYQDLGVWHGIYSRDAFNDLVRQIRPSFVGLFSIWAETYSHTLTEALAAGIPVLASRLGALGERIGRHGGGWLVDTEDPEGALDLVLQVAADPIEYERVAAEIDIGGVPTTRDMGKEYEHLYRTVLHARRLGAHVGGASTRGDLRYAPTVGR
ncbi:MAG: glycosyltransferase [Acidimicrobiia bacterium]